MIRILVFLIWLIAGLLLRDASAQQPPLFEIKLDPSAAQSPVTGRLLLFVSQRSSTPMRGPNWFSPEPFFGVDVKDLAPGAICVIDGSADSFPEPISKLPKGKYTVQAILDQDFYYSDHANGPGNIYSEPRQVEIGQQSSTPITLTLDQRIGAPQLADTKWLKFVSVKSRLLEKFHGREVVERAAVVLPPGYFKEPQRRFPVYYTVTGFGGTLRTLKRRFGSGQPQPADGATEFIRVILTGQCKWGHHVYANSETNGPRGDALVRELIPKIDAEFRTIAKPTARFVGGHSSGGWSSLWLQIKYPDTFGGVWSTAPDPVDFRDWQGTDLYAAPPQSVFYDADGNKKPLARRGTTPVIWYSDFCKMDDVMGSGGQLRSFEAVFSPRAADGQPARCWDRKTGEVNPQVVEYWKRYDISLVIEQNWKELAPKLSGKLHVYMGDLDTFYLEGATKLLGQRLRALGSDAVVEVFPGKDHGSVMTPELRHRIAREMTAKFRQHHPEQ